MQDLIILVDLDRQLCRNFARRLRSECICCRIMPADVTADELLAEDPRGIILVTPCNGEIREIPQMMNYLQTGLPMLCIGDAALTLATTLNGAVGDMQEGGLIQLEVSETDALLEGIESDERYLPDHRLIALPGEQGLPVVCTEVGCIGFHVTQRDVWGLAMPLDRNDPSAARMLMNFCRDVCGCTQWWTDRALIERARAMLADAAGEGEAICALSGGVDSGVCALLGQLALGERLHCLFVDTGLLRENEAEDVMAFYRDKAGLNVTRIDASAQFLEALDGVYAPGDKEKVVNRLLQEILYQETAKHPNVKVLIRGTNYSDTPLTDDNLPEGLIPAEPVRELFKDEIRHVGDSLGMPLAMLQKQPFPGSGLATRILSGVTATGLTLLRHADALFRAEIEAARLQKRLWQYFATLALSPIPNGGYIVILRAVQASDGGSGMPARLPFDLMERVTEAIQRECPGVQRVFYDLSPSQSYKRLAGG